MTKVMVHLSHNNIQMTLCSAYLAPVYMRNAIPLLNFILKRSILLHTTIKLQKTCTRDGKGVSLCKLTPCF